MYNKIIIIHKVFAALSGIMNIKHTAVFSIRFPFSFLSQGKLSFLMQHRRWWKSTWSPITQVVLHLQSLCHIHTAFLVSKVRILIGRSLKIMFSWSIFNDIRKWTECISEKKEIKKHTVWVQFSENNVCLYINVCDTFWQNNFLSPGFYMTHVQQGSSFFFFSFLFSVLWFL